MIPLLSLLILIIDMADAASMMYVRTCQPNLDDAESTDMLIPHTQPFCGYSSMGVLLITRV